jgi:hypothetical protein
MLSGSGEQFEVGGWVVSWVCKPILVLRFDQAKHNIKYYANIVATMCKSLL